MAHAHPTYDMLRSYALGEAPEGVSLLVAAHATYCPLCRDEIARIESITGALMAAEEGVAMAPGALEAVLARLETPDD
ncbi:MAG: hypothetical protein ACK4WC_15915, partial [Rubrimonas sp.]